MIISQTPLRVSLLGGGTDFREFYAGNGGAVLSLAIDKYIHVIVKDRFDDKIVLNYSRKEVTDGVDEIQHELVRESMRRVGVEKGVEITSLADIPSEGSGLGSSSSVTVGLLNALYGHRGTQVSAERLASEACEIEINVLGKPLGLQDQFIAAFGNLCFIEFGKEPVPRVERLCLSESQKRCFVSNLLVFYTNTTRRSETILRGQREHIPIKIRELSRLRDLAYEGRELLLCGRFDEIGPLIHENWLTKKSFTPVTSSPEIDRMYCEALSAGASGGKIAGAGGGGFMIVYCRPERQNDVRRALSGHPELPISLSRDGSKIIFNINS